MMMSRGATRVAGSMKGRVGPRFFSTLTIRSGAGDSITGVSRFGGSDRVAAMMGVRNGSTLTLDEKEQHEENIPGTAGSAGGTSGGDGKGKDVVSYWGVEPAKVIKEDGTQWKWNSFRVRSKFLGNDVNFSIFDVLHLILINYVHIQRSSLCDAYRSYAYGAFFIDHQYCRYI